MVRRTEGRVAVITGAAGGMGLACARQLGRSFPLILADIDASRLGSIGAQFCEEGYQVAGTVPGDLRDSTVIASLVACVRKAGPPGPVVHTAGVSPEMASWQDILTINLAASARLVSAIDPLMQNESVAVLIASIAGHMAPPDAECDSILRRPMDSPLADAIKPHFERLLRGNPAASLESLAYLYSKRGVIQLCERQAPDWGRRGARIVSLSPGLIWTAMARREVGKGRGVEEMLRATPLDRWGAPHEIASAVEFLVSDHARFITGCDLRIDGGVTAAMRN